MKRLGLLLPSSGTVQEVDFYRRLPDDVTLHSARMRLAEATAEAETRMLDEHTIPAARDLATVRPDVVVFSCTSAGALRGNAYEMKLCDELASITGAPVISTMAAVRDELRRNAVQSVAVLTPYPKALNERIRASLAADGLRVSVIVGLGHLDSHAIAAVTPETIEALAIDTFRKAPADGVFVACCTFRAFDARERIERALGVPVVTSNQAAFDAAMRRLDVAARPRA